MRADSKRDIGSCLAICLLFGSAWSQPGAIAEQIGSKSWTSHKLSHSKNHCSVTIEYPVFHGQSPKIRMLNKGIQKIVFKQYRDAISGQSHDINSDKGPPGEYKAKYTVDFLNNKSASLHCNVEDYIPDAATSSVEVQTFNFALDPYSELKIGKLFKDDVDYQEVLKTISLSQLYDKTGNAIWSHDVCDYDLEQFVVKSDNLVLFFKQHTPDEVVSISIPLCQIRALLNQSTIGCFWARHSDMIDDEIQILEIPHLKEQLARIAIGTYSKMIDAEPTNALAFQERGAWYQKLGRSEVAAKDLEQAKKLSGE